MKFIHTSCPHIGSGFKSIPNYLERSEKEIDEIYSIAERNSIKIVLITGDIFQKNEPTQLERDLLLKKILHYDRKFITILLEGNHDSVDSKTSSIHFLKLLQEKGKFKNTFIAEINPEVIDLPDAYIIALPTFKTKIIKILLNKLPKNKKPVIVMGHQATLGAVTDSGRTLKGSSIAKLKKFKRIVYFAMGHVHKFQRLELPNAFQSGSPIQHRFDEQLPKGILLVDTKHPTKPRLVSLKTVRPLVVVREGEHIPKDAYVKVLLKSKDLRKENLPNNVIATDYIRKNQSISEYELKGKITDGLVKFLKEKNYKSKKIKQCLKIINTIKQQLKVA